jgi:diguanylate cyclase (GGDEF)-like protein/PAS domain S-box-containing protein
VIDRTAAAEKVASRAYQLLLALSQAAQAVQRARTPRDVYRTVLNEVERIGHHAAIFTLTEDGAYLSLSYLTFESTLMDAAEKTLGFSVQGYCFPVVAGGFFENVLRASETVFTEPVAESLGETLPLAARPLADRLAQVLGIRQAIYAPLILSGEPHGLLTVVGTGLTDADVAAVAAFASQIAIALENTRLYDAAHRELSEREKAEVALRERVKELTSLYAVTRDTQGQLPLEQFCTRAVQNLVLGMQFPDTAVAVLELHGRRFCSTERARDLSHGLHATILVSDQERGRLSVYYSDPLPFLLPEEQDLTDAIAETISYWLERSLIEEALVQSEARYRSLFNHVPLGLYRSTLEGTIIDANPALVEMLGYPDRDSLLAMNAADLYVDAAARSVQQDVLEREGVAFRYELELRKRDGTTIWVEDNVIAVRDSEGHILYNEGSIQDITRRKADEETIRQLAYHDYLTGLPNRTVFNDRLGLAIARSRRARLGLAVMLLDLDHFKDINDTLGHSVGDKLLLAVSERLVSLLRESDTVCRMGGDEFLVLVEGLARAEDVETVAEAIIEQVRLPFAVDGHTLVVTTSIGTAAYPVDGEDKDTLIRHADIAMYAAKKAGRDNYQRYVPSLDGQPSSIHQGA